MFFTGQCPVLVLGPLWGVLAKKIDGRLDFDFFHDLLAVETSKIKNRCSLFLNKK